MATFQDPTLYVGDLHKDVNDSDLLQIFSPLQGFLHISLPKNHNSKQIYGYAYVNFKTLEDAQLAVENLNYKEVKGRQIRLMLYQKDPSFRNLQYNNMIIKNLDRSCTSQDLFTFLKDKYGKEQIVSCLVKTDNLGKSKRFGFVQFATEEVFKRVLQEINGQKIKEEDKKSLVACEFQKKNERNQEENFNNLYIKNLPNDISESQLKEMFMQFGDIISTVIKQDSQQRFYAFLCFKNSEMAKKAIEKMHGKEYMGQQLYVVKHLKHEERLQLLNQNYKERKDQEFMNVKGLNLYIKNLHASIGENELKELFKKFGEITSVKIEKSTNYIKKDNQFQVDEISKGFGFVCFQTQEAAEKAQKEMHGSLVIDQHIYVNFAQKKVERVEKLKKIKQWNIGKQGLCQSHQMFGTFNQHHFHNRRFNTQHGHQAHFNNHHQHQHFKPIQQNFNPNLPNKVRNYQEANAYKQGMNPQQRFKMTMVPFQMPFFMPLAQPMMPYNQTQFGQIMHMRGHQWSQRPFVPQEQAHPQNVQQIPIQPPAMQPYMPPVVPVQQGYPPQNLWQAQYGQINPQMVQQQQQFQQQIPQQQQDQAQNQLPFNPSDLSKMNQQERKQFLGELLWQKVNNIQPQLAGKITGMLLEIEEDQILILLRDDQILKEKVREAEEVLEAHLQGQQQK